MAILTVFNINTISRSVKNILKMLILEQCTYQSLHLTVKQAELLAESEPVVLPQQRLKFLLAAQSVRPSGPWHP